MALERLLDGTHADTIILPDLYQNTNLSPRERPQRPRGVVLTPSAEVSSAGTAQLIIKAEWEPSVHTIVIDITGPAGFRQNLISSGSETTIIVPWPGAYSAKIYNRNRSGQLSLPFGRSVLVDASTLPGVVNITSITDNGDGTITINYDTGNSVTIPIGKGVRNVFRDEATGDVRVVFSDGTTTNIAIKDGAAGGTTEWIYRSTTTATAPTRPTTTEAQRMMLDFVPTGWSDDPTTGTYVWVSSRKRAVSTDPFGEFSPPAPFRGPRGFRGARGAPGTPAPRIWQRIFNSNSGILVEDSRTATNTVPITLDADINNYDLIQFVATCGNGRAGVEWDGKALPARVFSTTSPQVIASYSDPARGYNIEALLGANGTQLRLFTDNQWDRTGDFRGDCVLYQVWGISNS